MVVSQDSVIITYIIDEIDHIVEVGGDWDEFASKNNGETILKENVESNEIWHFIKDSGVRYLYRVMIEKIRKLGGRIEFPFRCDSCVVRRFMKLEIEPYPNDTVRFVSTVLNEEERPRIDMMDPALPKSDEIVRICSWCKKNRTR